MKKFFPILMLAFVGLFIFSCDNNDDNYDSVDYDTYSQMRDATGSFTSADNYTLSMDITIQNTDVVLVYRKEGNYWVSVPKTYFLDNVSAPTTGRELDYNFNFNTNEVNIMTSANFDQSTQMSATERNQYLNNQTFRVVLVPASATKTANAVDLQDYNAVVKYYNLNDSNVKSFIIK